MPRPVSNHVIVITGASSGIGRESAIVLGGRGASVVLAARNKAALHEVAREVERLGGIAEVVVTDVADWPQVERLAQAAVRRFGRIDTWVNNAAVSIYATVEELTVEEIERVLHVNLLGQIYGVKAALPHLTGQGRGTIINVASALADRAAPLQAAYCAAKHGVKGFTEALRLELARDHPGITVTLIEPSSINTPLFRQARSKLGVLPQPIPPVYEPRVVAEAILFAVEHPRRDIVVGGSGKLLTVMQRLSPALVDWYMLQRGRAFTQQRTNQPDDGRDNLFAPLSGTGATTGEFGQDSRSESLYTRVLECYPSRQRALVGAGLVSMAALARRIGR
jgi:NAD(P)-dependent dehydrogenase (short-subunit alcohol dehydrogenase family)